MADKGEVFAHIPHMDTLFTVQAFPARASIYRNNLASIYTLTLDSKMPKLEAAVFLFAVGCSPIFDDVLTL